MFVWLLSATMSCMCDYGSSKEMLYIFKLYTISYVYERLRIANICERFSHTVAGKLILEYFKVKGLVKECEET